MKDGHMMLLFFVILALTSCLSAKEAPGNLQLLEYLQNHPEAPGILTTSYGYPVATFDAFNGSRRDSNLLTGFSLEQLSSFSAERSPPRGNHANGSGAKGYFQVTHDVCNITNAKVFNGIGKKTPITVRFSTASGEIGSSEVLNGNKGFGIKFYTEEGNMDLLGLSFNAFAVKDPKMAVQFLHVVKPNPKTGVADILAAWDFVANHPYAMYAFIQTFAEINRPKSYRFMPAHALHTFQVENDAGDVSFVKFNWEPESGVQFLTNDEFKTIGATNPDYLTQDLYNAISNETYPTYILSMQVVPMQDLNKVNYSIFDITMNLPKEDFPYIPVGKIVIDKHVDNHYAEIEQLALNPGNLAPGIRGVDPMLYARRFMYRDGQIHRMSRNFNNIPINCPLTPAKTFNRDGRPPVLDNGGDRPNYYPSSFNALTITDRKQAPLYRPNIDPGTTNLWQVAKFFYDSSEEDQRDIVNKAAKSLAVVPELVFKKIIRIFDEIDANLSKKIQVAVEAFSSNAST